MHQGDGSELDAGSRTRLPLRMLEDPASARRRGRPPRSPAPPLDAAEERRARAVLGRLRIDLATVLRGLGVASASPTALARALSLDRATAHRLLHLAQSGRGTEIEAVAGAPGPDAIDTLLRSAKSRGVDAGALTALAHATEQYRRLLGELGGSKAHLERRIAESARRSEPRPTESEIPTEQVSERLFDAAVDLLGRRTEVRVDMMIVRRTPRRRDVFDFAQVRGIIGHTSSRHALPMSIDLFGRVLAPGAAAPKLLTLRGEPAGTSLSSTLLRPFCSDPPGVALSQGVGERVQNVIDARGGRADVVLGYRRSAAFRHPRLESPPTLEVGALMREATERLIVDLFFERDALGGAVPDGEVYVWSPTLETGLADHWLDRLPHAPPVQVLGSGLARAASPLWARHGELVEYAFGELGWDPDRFLGFRLEVERPLWGCAYFVVLDFGGGRR